MGELAQLRGLGDKSEEKLNKIGVYSKQDLQAKGTVPTFVELGEPHLCFLYALAGALENRS
ncbi:TfoX/Sxy family DNA transformation protein [Abyssogena phaseoliformis symbiont]|uniref:TfoX/Sxy family DNA transformation protein n=1 Tax=Abyssogena phaseoliformis symbiont TaxID=596095 RepID=UPI00191561B1|nr:TfoX/Sxy family DNA transformation protein [Abyssogena phaseoliformis symbiont]